MEKLFKFLKPNESITIEFLAKHDSYRITLCCNIDSHRKTQYYSQYTISKAELDTLCDSDYVITHILEQLRINLELGE